MWQGIKELDKGLVLLINQKENVETNRRRISRKE